MGWGARWIVYWQLYCNEPARVYTTERPINRDMRGFWLVRPDGVKTRMYGYFLDQLGTSLRRTFFRGAGDRYITVENGGGGSVSVAAAPPPVESALILRDENGGSLRNGDRIHILVHNGMYLREAEDGDVLADRRDGAEGTEFVLRKIGAKGHGVLGPSDPVALEAPSGRFLGAGSDGLLRALPGEPGEAGTFHIVFAE
jgi:hypothetical protein